MNDKYWKSLCAKLVEKWGNGEDYWTVIHEMNDALHVEPEPQELTDEELCRLWDKASHYFALYDEAIRFARFLLDNTKKNNV
jgi:3-methyladenine DNA glycosylase/8-oxoguanine DNA glycosylase